jgi:CubicO group peptidase (beta-lactamase class C family)
MPSTAVNDVFDADFDDQVIQLMEAGHIPSIAACVIDKDTVIWSNAYGENPDVDIVYNAGPIGKTFTATAILQLYEQGLLELDDDVSDYYTEAIRNPNYPDTPITFEQILSFRSSLLMKPPGNFSDPEIWSDKKPGETFMFTQLGHILLGEIIASLSGKTFEDYIADNILTPLDMTMTSYQKSTYLYPVRQAPGYFWNPDTGVNDEIGLMEFPPIFNPAGQIRSTVLDMSHYLIAHMNGGIYNGVRILEESHVDLMRINHGNFTGLGWHPDLAEHFNQFTASYTLNWPDLEGCYGDWVGYFCVMAYSKTEQRGMILFTNQGIWPGDPESEKVQKNVMDLYGLIVNTALEPPPPPDTALVPEIIFPMVTLMAATTLITLIMYRERKK